MPENSVRETGVADVFPAYVVESFGSVRRAHTVHLHDDEAEFSHGLHGAVGAETLGDEGVVGAGVDVFEDGVRLGGVEVGGFVEKAPDIGFVVAGFGGKDFGRTPAAGPEGGVVGPFECRD